MTEYPKIESVFVRDEKTHKFIDGAWRLPEFEYLKDTEWIWTEKVDGTNIRVMWDGQAVCFGGRTDRAQLYVPLLDRLMELFPPDLMRAVFPDSDCVCLYGEGHGARIQKGGGNYIADGVDFVLFDVKVGPWWLKRDAVVGIADKLRIHVVPYLGFGTLPEAIKRVQSGLQSNWGDFAAEGLVCRPMVDLMTRSGHRIITKIKGKDW